ncbi:MAG TPA: diguanylate cyclase [Myxococcota bacterium]|nr:diguanylate cyclase [Myxococcota bacterium]
MEVLVADDDPTTRLMMKGSLERLGYQVRLATDGNEALAILGSENPPRLAILDWEMPGATGVEVCRWIRTGGDEPYTYIILLTSRTSLSDIVEAMDAGADSFIRKPVEPNELKARLRPGHRMLDLQRQLIRAREAYRYQARHDGLTGLYNRSAIVEILKTALESGPVSVAMLDVDHFKQINDQLGHDVGDRVLVELGRVLTHSLRPEDAVGRLGGEEFLLVLPGVDTWEAARVGERLRKRVEELQLTEQGRPLPVSISVGVATAAAHTPYTELLKRSDRTMYAAKHAGRNKVIVWSDDSPDMVA